MTNQLAVRVNGDEVTFVANGTDIYTGPASQMYTDGVFGMRANHNLHLRIEEFGTR